MPEEFEVDPGELAAEIREHQRLTGTRSRRSRGWHDPPRSPRQGRRCGGGGVRRRCARRTAAAATAKSGKFTGTLRVITLGVEWPTPEVQKKAEAGPRLQVRPDRHRPGDDGPEGDHRAGDLRHLRRLQLPVHPDVFVASPDADRHARRSRPGRSSTSCSRGARCIPARAARPTATATLRSGRSSSSRARPACRCPRKGRGPNKDIVQWVTNEAHQRDDGARCPGTSSVRPAHFNADSIGYNADVLKKLPNQVGWQELLNKQWKGKVALLKDPGIVMQDVGNALKALGIFKPKDMGNMTQGRDRPGREGRDHLQEGRSVPRLLGELQRVGQPDGLEGGRGRVDVVTGGGAPGRAGHQRQVREAAHGLPRLVQRSGHRVARRVRSREAAGLLRLHQLDVRRVARRDDHAPGLLHRQRGHAQGWIAKNGAANPAGGIPFKTDEYDFWYNGARAGRDLPGITGKVGDIKKGSVRDGGSFAQRIGHYSSWNSYFTKNAYQVKRWNDFLSA